MQPENDVLWPFPFLFIYDIVVLANIFMHNDYNNISLPRSVTLWVFSTAEPVNDRKKVYFLLSNKVFSSPLDCK
ncbi:MAG: hypothetical protein M3250_01310 [Thermoproteota archaeon]|nr:hypothetical protein [Thermoproteota archaeon]